MKLDFDRIFAEQKRTYYHVNFSCTCGILSFFHLLFLEIEQSANEARDECMQILARIRNAHVDGSGTILHFTCE